LAVIYEHGPSLEFRSCRDQSQHNKYSEVRCSDVFHGASFRKDCLEIH